MLCPFDLAQVAFNEQRAKDRPGVVFSCPQCKQEVPAQYVRDYFSYPPVVVTAVGFRGHGKSVYFASLLHVLRDGILAGLWDRWNFYTQALHDTDLEIINENIRRLKNGQLPEPTRMNFPRPTMIRVSGMPMGRNCTWLCYDPAGESFNQARQLVRYANFVSRASSVLFMISLPDLMQDPNNHGTAQEMQNLLDTYITGLGDLGARPGHQHLVVVYTKADELGVLLDGKWRDLRDYLIAGDVDDLAHPSGYIRYMHHVSSRLKRFTKDVLHANGFLNMARDRFKTVEFCLVSALGAQPRGQRLAVGVRPKRVLDPMLWVMLLSQGRWARWWERLFK